MNQRRGWEDETSSRAVNAQPWEPMPGMVKRQCPECRYFFAAPPGADGVASNLDLPTDVPASTAKEINHGRRP